MWPPRFTSRMHAGRGYHAALAKSPDEEDSFVVDDDEVRKYGRVEEEGDDSLVGKLDKPRTLAAMAAAITFALQARRADEISVGHLAELRLAIDAELAIRNCRE